MFLAAVESYDNLIYFYEQNISSSVNGLIKYKTSSGEQKVFKSLSNQSFDAFDCLTIGKQSFNNKDFRYALKWFKEALNRVDNQTNADLKDEIEKYYSESIKNLLEVKIVLVQYYYNFFLTIT